MDFAVSFDPNEKYMRGLTTEEVVDEVLKEVNNSFKLLFNNASMTKCKRGSHFEYRFHFHAKDPHLRV